MIEARVIKEVKLALKEDKGKFLSYQLNKEEASLEDWMICGGNIKVFDEKIIIKIFQLNTHLRGWIQCFSLSNTFYVPTRIEGWMRRRLRMCLWKQWKKTHTRYRKLIQLGLPGWKVLSLANTRKACWHIAGDSLNSVLPRPIG
jgi:hypothetical protein